MDEMGFRVATFGGGPRVQSEPETRLDRSEAGVSRELMMSLRQGASSAEGRWWDGFEPQTILSACHYAGEQDTGTLVATADGISYSTIGGATGHCPWSDVVKIEVAESKTRFGHQRNVKGNGRVDLVVVGTAAVLPRHIVTVTDTRGQRFNFVSEDSSQAEITRVVAII